MPNPWETAMPVKKVKGNPWESAPIDASPVPDVPETTSRAYDTEKRTGLVDIIKGVAKTGMEMAKETGKATVEEFKPGGRKPGETIAKGIGSGIAKGVSETVIDPVLRGGADITRSFLDPQSKEAAELAEFSEGIKESRAQQWAEEPSEQRLPRALSELATKIAIAQQTGKATGGMVPKGYTGKLPSVTGAVKNIPHTVARAAGEAIPFAAAAYSTGDVKEAFKSYAVDIAFDLAMAGIPMANAVRKFMDSGLDKNTAEELAQKAYTTAKGARKEYKAALKGMTDLKKPMLSSLVDTDLAVLYKPMSEGTTPFHQHMAKAKEYVVGDVDVDPLTEIAKTKLMNAYDKIRGVTSKAGEAKSNLVEKHADQMIDISDLKNEWSDLSKQRIGVDPFDPGAGLVDGKYVGEVPVEPSSIPMLEKAAETVNRLPDQVTFTQLDQARRNLRDIYEAANINAPRPKHGPTENVIDEYRDMLTNRATSTLNMVSPKLGDEYMALNKRYAQLINAEKMLGGKLGKTLDPKTGTPLMGPNLLKAASSSNYGPGVAARDLFDVIKRETGQDLLQDAQYAQLAMRLAGIPRSSDLLSIAQGGTAAGLPGVYGKAKAAMDIAGKSAEMVTGDDAQQAVNYWSKMQKIHAKNKMGVGGPLKMGTPKNLSETLKAISDQPVKQTPDIVPEAGRIIRSGAGAVGGGAVGAATGETEEEKLRNALIGILSGAGIGAGSPSMKFSRGK